MTIHHAQADACAIAQGILEDTEVALLSGDADRFLQHFAVPHTTISYNETVVCNTQDELRTLFRRASNYYISHGITQISRRCHSAIFQSSDYFIAAYTTRLLGPGGTLVRAPAECLSEAKLIDGRWRVVRDNVAIDKDDDRRNIFNPPVPPQASGQ